MRVSVWTIGEEELSFLHGETLEAVCWYCGKNQFVDNTKYLLGSKFSVVKMTKQIGWKYRIDFSCKRIFPICTNDECNRKAIKDVSNWHRSRI